MALLNSGVARALRARTTPNRGLNGSEAHIRVEISPVGAILTRYISGMERDVMPSS